MKEFQFCAITVFLNGDFYHRETIESDETKHLAKNVENLCNAWVINVLLP